MKKFLSVLFIILAALSLYSVFTNSNQSSYTGRPQTEAAYRAGQSIATILPIALYILSAVFFFNFDSIYKKSYTEGFAARKKQCTAIIILCILAAIPAFSAAYLIGALSQAIMVSNEPLPLSSVISVIAVPTITFIIPCLILLLMLDVYYLPYRLSKKLFLYDSSAINYYFSNNVNFTAFSQDGFVMANDKALFLPKFFCVIPFDAIESVKSSLPWLTVIKLTNGKKFKLYTKHYKDIAEAVRVHKIA